MTDVDVQQQIIIFFFSYDAILWCFWNDNEDVSVNDE